MSVRGEWSDAFARRWLVAGRDGLDLSGTKDLTFLPAVPGLRALRVSSPTRADAAVAECTELQFLDLDTDARTPLDLSRLADLRHLVVEDRAGFESVRDLPRVEQLTLGGLPEQDLSFLGPKPALRWLSIGRWQRAGERCLDGLGAAPALQELSIQGLRQACDLSPVGELGDLRQLTVVGPDRQVTDGVFDLTPLAAAAALYEVQLHHCALESVTPLLDVPGFERVLLWRCAVRAGDVSALEGRFPHLDVM
jgi:hypothetical protein